MTDSTDSLDRARKFAFFILGVALPIAGWLFWSKTNGFSVVTKKARTDRAHDVTVEDSFPASDPPSAW
jgi:hypothetical protein